MIHLKKHMLFSQLAKLVPDNSTIVEGGSFHAHDTIRMAQTWPSSTIYTFEPVPELFAITQANTQKYTNISCFNLALSDSTGSAQFWPSEHPKKKGVSSQAGSLLQPKERLEWSNISFTKPYQVQTITLDDWAEQNNIKRIDFLWLDLQGMELPVLQASPKIMQTVSYIYTEVHFIEAYAQQKQYKEVISWLEQQGFCMIAKDYTETESWFFGNVLFKRTS